MKGKTVVITGGTSGIGEIAAERLAQMGARIILIAQDKSRGEATLARLHERAPGLGHAAVSAEMLYHIVSFLLVRIAIALLWLRLRKIRAAIGRQG
jgi:NAD(P)-dependent dehydrogenase (short-subunit alcohol dehydrogenase family)